MYSEPEIFSDETGPNADAAARHVLVAEFLEAIGRRGFVPFIAAPAVMGLFPSTQSLTTAIICAVFVAFAAVQMIFGCQFVKLPRRLAHHVSQNKLFVHMVEASLTFVEWLDNVSYPKLRWLVTGPASIVPNFILLLTAISLPILTYLGFPIFLFCTALLIYCVALLTTNGRYLILSGATLSIASIQPVLLLGS